MIYPHYPGKPNRGFFLGASPRTHEKVKVKTNMPALHWSSPGSGGPSTVVLFVFFEGPLPKKKWQGESVLYFFFVARLKTRDRWSYFNTNLQNKEKFPKHASCDNSLAPPSNINIWLVSGKLLDKDPAWKIQLNEGLWRPSWWPSFEQASARTLLKTERLLYKQSSLECL